MARTQVEAILLLVLLTLIWGTNWPLFRLVLQELTIWQFRSFVAALAAVVLFAAVWARGERLGVTPGRWGALVASSLGNLVFWSIGTALAVVHLPSGHAAVLGYTMPLWLALISALVLRERFGLRMWSAIGFGAAAVTLLMIPSFGALAGAPVGLAAGLIAAFAWAIGTLIVKRTDWGGMQLSITAWQMTLAVPPILLGAWLIDSEPWHMPSTAVAATTLYIAIIPMALGTATWFAIVHRVPAQVAALSSVSIPVVAVVAGVITFGEPMGPMQLAALVCTVISLWLALVPPKREAT